MSDGAEATTVEPTGETLLNGQTAPVEPEKTGEPEKTAEPVKAAEPEKKDDAGAGEAEEVVAKQTEEEKAEAAKAAGAPEKYEAFKDLDGNDIADEDISTFAEFAKEFNLSQEQAQKMLDRQLKEGQEDIESQQTAYKEMVNGWRKDAQTDKHQEHPIGGEHFDGAVAAANRAIQTFGTPELIDVLKSTGVGNHPEFIRAFARVGKEIGEDTLVPGGRAKNTERSVADTFYPSLQNNQ